MPNQMEPITMCWVQNFVAKLDRNLLLPKADDSLIRSYFLDPCGALLLKDNPEQLQTATKICNAIGIRKTIDLFSLPRAIPTQLKGIAV